MCLSLLQKHEHIVEMYGACNSEQVRKREGGEVVGEGEGEGEGEGRKVGKGRSGWEEERRG